MPAHSPTPNAETAFAVTIATRRKVATPTSDVRETDPTPQILWPEVHPLPDAGTDSDEDSADEQPPSGYLGGPAAARDRPRVALVDHRVDRGTADDPDGEHDAPVTDGRYCANRDCPETYERVDSRNVLAPAVIPVPRYIKTVPRPTSSPPIAYREILFGNSASTVWGPAGRRRWRRSPRVTPMVAREWVCRRS